tara:strand:- start:1178 stop:2110 length:933 start_codon:yes stop_codon:yes gene_type:complete
MNFLKYFNGLLSNVFSKNENVYVYGQNVATGSCLSGLTRNLELTKSSKIANSPNSENSLVGIGFGAMLRGIHAVFCMKQQDFLLLGIDHLVNTNNIMRNETVNGSFTIISIIEDGGYEGPQSALNNFSDFASIARIDCYSITNNIDAKAIIGNKMLSPGFKIIGISQRLLSQSLIEISLLKNDDHLNYFQYKDGNDVTIICYNFSLPYGLEIVERFKEKGFSASLFSINTFISFDYSAIIEDVSKTKNIIIIDDSKSCNLSCYELINSIQDKYKLENKRIIKRDYSSDYFYPRSDVLDIDYENIVTSFFK